MGIELCLFGPTVSRLQYRSRTRYDAKSRNKITMRIIVISETPLWLLVHVAPIKSNNDAIMLILLLFKDITVLKQLIPEQNGKGMSVPTKL